MPRASALPDDVDVEYVGVHYNKSREMFQSKMTDPRTKKVAKGELFDDPMEAAFDYDRRVRKLWDDFKIPPTALNFADPEDIARWPGLRTASQEPVPAEADSDTEEQQGAARMEVGAAPAWEEGPAPMRSQQQQKKKQHGPSPSSSHAKRPASARRGLSGPGRGGGGSEAAVRRTRRAEEGDPRHVQEDKFVELVRAAMLELELRCKMQWALDKPQVAETKEREKEPWRKVDWLHFFHELRQPSVWVRNELLSHVPWDEKPDAHERQRIARAVALGVPKAFEVYKQKMCEEEEQQQEAERQRMDEEGQNEDGEQQQERQQEGEGGQQQPEQHAMAP